VLRRLNLIKFVTRTQRDGSSPIQVILLKAQKARFQDNPQCANRALPCRQMDKRGEADSQFPKPFESAYKRNSGLCILQHWWITTFTNIHPRHIVHFIDSSCLQLLTFWRRGLFFNFSTPCIQNVNNTGAKYVRIMKQAAVWREKDGEYIQRLKYSVPIFVE